MTDVAESVILSPERVLTGTVRVAFLWNGERCPVSATTIPAHLWGELVSTAKLHGLAALFYAALSNSASPELPAEPLAELRDLYLRSRMATRLANDALGRLIDGFANAGVPLLVLKGAALSAALYPEPGLRPFGDIDLMIHRTDLPAAQMVLTEKGFATIGERHEGFSENFLKSLNYAVPGGTGPAIDLHWHLFAPMYYRRRISMDFFWQNPLGFTLGDHSAFTLAPLQQLVHLTAHAGLHHTRVPLVWLYDIARWIGRFENQIDWDEFVRNVQKLELASAAVQVLQSAVEWWGAAVPPAALAALAQTRSGAGARLVHAIYASPQGGARGVVDMLYQEGLGSKAAFATQLLLPSREYMQARSSKHSNGSMLGLYTQRVWRITRFVTRSVWGMLTGAKGTK